MYHYISLIGATAILFYASLHDIETHTVQWFTPILLFASGISYMLIEQIPLIDVISILIFILFLFGLPCIFGMGIGDLLLFLGIGFFLRTISGVWLYILIFILCWTLWNIYMVVIAKWEGTLQSYRSAFSKETFFTLEYPLVPAIAIAFLVFLAMQI